jgi:cysteine synthase A
MLWREAASSSGHFRSAKSAWLFAGPSSGANLIAARKVKEAYPELKTIVTLFCDEGEKYIQDHFAEEVRVTSETYT